MVDEMVQKILYKLKEQIQASGLTQVPLKDLDVLFILPFPCESSAFRHANTKLTGDEEAKSQLLMALQQCFMDNPEEQQAIQAALTQLKEELWKEKEVSNPQPEQPPAATPSSSQIPPQSAFQRYNPGKSH